MINLSPFSDGHAWQRAQREATRITAHPDQITALIAHTRALYLERSDELAEILEDIEALWAAAERVRSTSDASQPDDIRKTAALIYLLNPYDERFDGIRGTGLQDDVAVIKMANKPTVVSAQS